MLSLYRVSLLKVWANFWQLALMADSSLMETQHPSYIWMKLPLTHVCFINTAWQLSLQLMSMHGWGILMNVTRGFASVVYELGPNLIWLIWTDLFWVLMVLLFKETKCILESDFKACIDLLCSFTAVCRDRLKIHHV